MTLAAGFVHGGLEALGDASQEADGAVFNPATGMIQPVDSPRVPIYVQSPFTGLAVHAGGDDKYADYPISEVAGDISKRLRSEHGVQRLLRRATNGREIELVYLADMHGGDPESASETRVVLTRRLQVGGGEAGRIPIVRRGPKNWIPVTNGHGGPLTGLTFLGGGGGNVVDTRAIFGAATFGTDVRGWWRQQNINGDGRDVFFSIPVRKNDDHQVWIDAQLDGGDLNTDVGVNNPNNSFVTPAVLIAADDFMSEVLIEGFATPAIGDRSFTGERDNPQDVPFTFRQLHLVRPRLNVVGQCVFDRCLLDDSPIMENGNVGFFGAMAMQLIVFINSRPTWPVAMNSNSEAIEPCGQPEVFAQPLPPNANPMIPYNGTNLLVHGTMQVGLNYFGGGEAKLRFTKALSVAPSPIENSTTSHVTIQGRASTLYISNNGAAYLEASATFPVVRCKEDASMRAPFSAGAGRITIVDGGSGELMVGRDIVATPPITKAALLAAPWNGRFQRAAASLASPGDDQSYIVDSGWDTVDPTYNDGT